MSCMDLSHLNSLSGSQFTEFFFQFDDDVHDVQGVRAEIAYEVGLRSDR